jgi:hypothetical protein
LKTVDRLTEYLTGLRLEGEGRSAGAASALARYTAIAGLARQPSKGPEKIARCLILLDADPALADDELAAEDEALRKALDRHAVKAAALPRNSCQEPALA